MSKLVACSGGYDPLHEGHLRQLQYARRLGEALIVFLNSDAWLRRKKGYCMFPWEQRQAILLGLRWVDAVVPVNDRDGSVASALALWKPAIFAKGGDRRCAQDLPKPEQVVCQSIGCQVVYGVAPQLDSSQDAVDRACHAQRRRGSSQPAGPRLHRG